MNIEISSRTGVSLLFIICLVGCVGGPIPVVDSYHQVSATAGSVNFRCLPDEYIGPPSNLTLERGATTTTIIGAHLSGLLDNFHPSLSIEYYVPPGHKVEIAWNDFKAFDEETGAIIALPRPAVDIVYKKSIFAMQHSSIAPGSIFDPDALGAESDRFTPLYRIFFFFDKKIPNKFAFQLPDEQVDGVLYPGVVAHYQHTVGVFCTMGH